MNKKNKLSLTAVVTLFLLTLSSCSKDISDRVSIPDPKYYESVEVLALSGNANEWVTGNQMSTKGKSYDEMVSMLDSVNLVFSDIDKSTPADDVKLLKKAYKDQRGLLLDVKGVEGQKKMKQIAGINMGDGLYFFRHDEDGVYQGSIYQPQDVTPSFDTLLKRKPEVKESYDSYTEACTNMLDTAKYVGFTEDHFNKLKTDYSKDKWAEIKKTLIENLGEDNVMYADENNIDGIDMDMAMKDQITKDLKKSKTVAHIGLRSTAANNKLKAPTMKFVAFCYITDKDEVIKGTPKKADMPHIRFIVQVNWVARLYKLQKYGNDNIIEFFNEGPGTLTNMKQEFYGNWFSWVNNTVHNVPSNIIYYIEPIEPLGNLQIKLSSFAPKTVPHTTKTVTDKTNFSLTVAQSGPSGTLSVGREVTYTQDKAETNTNVDPITNGITWEHTYTTFDTFNKVPSREYSFFKSLHIGSVIGFKYNDMKPIKDLPEQYRKHWTLEHSAVYEVSKNVNNVKFKTGIKLEISNITMPYRGVFWDLIVAGWARPEVKTSKFDINTVMDVDWSAYPDLN
ncbi:hypothetical protein [Porphyromonas pogonae]|uniref:hypothetical protein n=1 Tax=Porphyromonas pogonae TaxID=867595 RepID=UPI002E75ADC8|nr:hypothetical protein [Porphyromonas pogonae]